MAADGLVTVKVLADMVYGCKYGEMSAEYDITNGMVSIWYGMISIWYDI